jgi:ribosome-binding ATPase
LVKGASQGEGLGNKFLSHIREVSVIAHVVRCFEDSNIVHVGGKINPLDDIEVINTELILADLELAEKLEAGLEKSAKRGDAEAKEKHSLLLRIRKALETNHPARSINPEAVEAPWLKSFNFLTAKKVIYVANVSETSLGKPNPMAETVRQYAETHGDAFELICARAEEEISKLQAAEKVEFLQALSIEESGLDVLAKKCFSLLGLQTYLTSGPKETRAWTIRQGDTAPQAAGVIHTDFERGFIRANIVSYQDFVRLGGFKEARDKGVLRQEGRDYVMRDGDVVEFLFNV